MRAIIGVGSNSTRLLLADTDGATVVRTQRLREGTRLIAGLEGGELTGESMARTAEAVSRLVMHAREAGAADEHIVLFATSAARDAANADAFAGLIHELTGIRMQVLTGEEEARLSFLGGAGVGFCGLIDIGGGSTEIIAWGGRDGTRPMLAASARLGAVRLLSEVPILLGDGLERAYAIARERIRDVWTDPQTGMPAAWFGVGGTMTCLASIDLRLPAFDRDKVDGHGLSIGAVEGWARRLSKMRQEERAALPGMLPQRADIIAHGAIVLWAAMDALGLKRITVSNRTNLDGYLRDILAREAQPDSVEQVKAYYDASVEQEWDRLSRHPFEFEINRRFIDRYVAKGTRVLDAGGGPGRYSLHLAALGADVTLLDLSPANVAFALAKAKERGLRLAGHAADVRALESAVEGTFDVVLLMGPMYHLLEEQDRILAVEACLRVLKPGGILCVAFIQTVAGMIYAAREAPESILWEGEDQFYNMILARRDFAGVGFTHAFFIDSDNVLPFMARFPLEKLHLIASESITAPFEHQLKAAAPEALAKWVDLAEKLAEREDLRAFAEHLLYIGRKGTDA